MTSEAPATQPTSDPRPSAAASSNATPSLTNTIKEHAAFYTAVAGVIPAATGTVCAWLYQYGRARHFRFPASLIRIEIGDVLFTLCTLLPCLLACGAVLLLGFSAEKLGRFASSGVLAVLAAAAECAALSGPLEELSVRPGLQAAMVTALACSVALWFPDRFRLAITRPEIAILVLASALLASGAATFVVGSYRAEKQSDFYVVTKGGKQYVALALYGDRLVLSPLAADCKSLQPQVVVRPLSKRQTTSTRRSIAELSVGDVLDDGCPP